MMPPATVLAMMALLLSLAACDSEEEGPESSARSRTLASIDACQGEFVCRSYLDELDEFYLKKERITLYPQDGGVAYGDFCALYRWRDDQRIQLLASDGTTAELSSWYQTEQGFVLDHGTTKMGIYLEECLPKSSYKTVEQFGEIEKAKGKRDQGSGSQGDCRGSGHFCGSSSVCCSRSCDQSSNTCN